MEPEVIDVPSAFSTLLRRHRQAAGFSQEELAERAGLSRRGIADLERSARRAPYPDTIQRLADALNLGDQDRDALLRARRRGLRLASRETILTSALGETALVSQPCENRRHNLPVQRTRLIGREQELAAVRGLVLGAEGRLVTLAGPGGVGKSRLALQAAAELVDTFPDGVWLLELAALGDQALVPQRVAVVLGLREQPPNRAIEALVNSLTSRDLLLLLDNCERLVAGCAQLADALLAGCPRLRVLVTSREPLRIPGEITWRVPSLAIPNLQSAPQPDELAVAPAVQLFVERAQAVQPAFALTAENAPTVGRICRRMDGMPLGIELAACRLRALGLEEILEHLDTSIRVLAGSSRTAPDHQQTLRATLDWSHALLTSAEQVVFRRLAVFAGGWSLEAAEAVCAGDPIGEREVLELLSGLVDKSVVVMDEQGGRARYRLLESVREYADERLELSGEVAVTQRRHAAYFLVLARRVGSTRPDLALQIEGQEQDNLRAALRWCLDHGEADMGLQLARGCMLFWHWRANSYEGRMWISQLLGLPGAEQSTPARANALGLAGYLAARHGDFAAARVLLEQGVATARDLGDPKRLFWSLSFRGSGALYAGEYVLAHAVYADALATAHAARERVLESVGLVQLAWHACTQANYETAHSLAVESVRLARASGEPWLLGIALKTLGNTMLGLGDVQLARRWFEEGLRHQRHVGNDWVTVYNLDGLAYVAVAQRQYAEAQKLLVESLTLSQQVGDVTLIARSLDGFAALAAARGQPERGLSLSGAAESLRENLNAPLHPEDRARRDRWLDPLRHELGAETVAEAWTTGKELTVDEALALALGQREVFPD